MQSLRIRRQRLPLSLPGGPLLLLGTFLVGGFLGLYGGMYLSGSASAKSERRRPRMMLETSASEAVVRPAGGESQAALQKPASFDPPPQGKNDSYVSACLSVKDEHCDIREWVLYHASVGINKVYIYDTGSKPPMEPQLRDLITSGLVEYHFVTNETMALEPRQEGHSDRWQVTVYNTCLQKYGERHRWMAFFDGDEYVFLKKHSKLPKLLRQYEAFGGLQLHWQFYSFSGHIMRPTTGVLRSYTACCPATASQSVLMKSIVQPQYATAMASPHHFDFRDGKFAVNVLKQRVNGPLSQPAVHDVAVLNHYFTRSLSDFEQKQLRRDGLGGRKELNFFLWAAQECTDTCTAAARLGEQLWQKYNLTLNTPDTCRYRKY